jgi:hypothetical protein
MKEREDENIMSNKDCCSTDDCYSLEDCCNVKVTVEVSKIVKYVSVAAVLIVGIIFGTMTFKKMLEKGFFDVVE